MYLLNSDSLVEESIVLLGVCSSSKKSNSLLDIYAKDEIILPISFVEEKIIQELLISTAVKCRMIDDMFIRKDKKPTLSSSSVGQLFIEDKTQVLTFRESTNKIIHAAQYLPETAMENGIEYFLPYINLAGAKGKKRWLIRLSVEQYTLNCLEIAKQYDEDWDLSARI